MKKTIQQAKVCVIGKLVRKLKNIQGSKGKEPTGLKLIGRKTRLTNQIDYLKVMISLLIGCQQILTNFCLPFRKRLI